MSAAAAGPKERSRNWHFLGGGRDWRVGSSGLGGGLRLLVIKAVVPKTEVLWILKEEASFRVRVYHRSAPTRQKIQKTTAR
jgi:hypothetical protein